jgi:hypothetical protein
MKNAFFWDVMPSGMTASQPVYLGVRLPRFVFCVRTADFLKWGALSDERMGL